MKEKLRITTQKLEIVINQEDEVLCYYKVKDRVPNNRLIRVTKDMALQAWLLRDMPMFGMKILNNIPCYPDYYDLNDELAPYYVEAKYAVEEAVKWKECWS